jgi:hypothetical protein
MPSPQFFHRFLRKLRFRYADSAGFFLIPSSDRPADRLRLRVDITHRGLDEVVPGDVLQRKRRPYTLPPRSEKRVADSVKSGIRIDHNLITGKLFPETSHSDSSTIAFGDQLLSAALLGTTVNTVVEVEIP